MPHGDSRRGAGRPKGSAMDPMCRSLRAATRARLLEIIESGSDPLSFLCDVVRDRSVDLGMRLCAAEIMLPYLHPRQNGCPPRIDGLAQPSANVLDIPS
jgi:hypothetical protein